MFPCDALHGVLPEDSVLKFPNPEFSHHDLERSVIADESDQIDANPDIVSLDIDANTGEVVAFRGTASAVRRICEQLLDAEPGQRGDDADTPSFHLRPATPTARPGQDSTSEPSTGQDSMGFSQAAEDAIRRRANPMHILAQLNARPASQDVTPSPFLNAREPQGTHAATRRDGA